MQNVDEKQQIVKDIAQWKIISYARGGKVPSCVELKTDYIRLRIHRHMHYDPDTWLLSTAPEFFNNQELENANIEDAQNEAIRLVIGTCELIKAELSKLANDRLKKRLVDLFQGES